jgi:transcriptional regulator with GAF, ATPase, and Fis domain
MSLLLDDLIGAFEKRAVSGDGMDPFGEVARILSALPDRTKFLEVLLSTARRCFFADHGVILSHHRPTDRWFIEASYGLDDAALEEIKGPSWTVIRQAAESSKSVLVADATQNELTRNSKSVRMHNIQAVLCAPILNAKGQIWGVIYLDNAGVPDAFDQESRKRLRHFADFCGIAIQRCDDLVQLTVQSKSPQGRGEAAEEPFYDFTSPVMVETMALLKRAAPTDVPILLVGETGVGKDYLARWIHENSARRDGLYTEVNCANIHPSLVEAELFGIESGAATEVKFREGRIRAADGGTVFLNEIGDLPLSTQAKILRVIQHRELDRVGGDTSVGADVRFVCASNRDLKAMVERGEFRRDLYFRINIFESRIPPLRDRIEDLPHFAEHILRQKCREHRRKPMRMPKVVVAQMATMEWKGNLRELANVIERGVILAEGDEFSLSHVVPGPVGDTAAIRFTPKDSLPDLLSRFETQVIREVLEEVGWFVVRAASKLRIPESTLRFKMKKLNIVPPTVVGPKRSL